MDNVTESYRNEYKLWVENLQKAWALVGEDLKTHGEWTQRIKVKLFDLFVILNFFLH